MSGCVPPYQINQSDSWPLLCAAEAAESEQPSSGSYSYIPQTAKLALPTGIFRPTSGTARLHLLNDCLSPSVTAALDIARWSAIVEEFFSPEAVISYNLTNSYLGGRRKFELHSASLPRHFMSLFQAAIVRIQFTFDNIAEWTTDSGSALLSKQAGITYHFGPPGQKIMLDGLLAVRFNHGMLIDSFCFTSESSVEMLPRGVSSELTSHELPGQPMPPPDPLVFGMPSLPLRNLQMADAVFGMANVIEQSLRLNLGPLDTMKHIFWRGHFNYVMTTNEYMTPQQPPLSEPIDCVSSVEPPLVEKKPQVKRQRKAAAEADGNKATQKKKTVKRKTVLDDANGGSAAPKKPAAARGRKSSKKVTDEMTASGIHPLMQ